MEKSMGTIFLMNIVQALINSLCETNKLKGSTKKKNTER